MNSPLEHDIAALMAFTNRGGGGSLEWGEKIVEALRRGGEATAKALGDIALKQGSAWNFEDAQEVDVVFIPGKEIGRQRIELGRDEVGDFYFTGQLMAVRSAEEIRTDGSIGGLLLKSLIGGTPPGFYDQAIVSWWDFRREGHQLAILRPQELRSAQL